MISIPCLVHSTTNNIKITTVLYYCSNTYSTNTQSISSSRLNSTGEIKFKKSMLIQLPPKTLFIKFILNHLPELPEDLVLPLDPFFLAEHGQGSLLIRAVDLVLFPQPDGLHPPVPGSTHHPPIIFIPNNLVTSQPNLSPPRNPLSIRNIGSHGLSLPLQQLCAQLFVRQLHLLRQNRTNDLLVRFITLILPPLCHSIHHIFLYPLIFTAGVTGRRLGSLLLLRFLFLLFGLFLFL